ncbi:hypothetical protein BDR26DRAFT_867658 [Obelidium mucronatum]|nr:hypothetical protein BDR26DRAFT_867658 [Obelidium mucronatum]
MLQVTALGMVFIVIGHTGWEPLVRVPVDCAVIIARFWWVPVERDSVKVVREIQIPTNQVASSYKHCSAVYFSGELEVALAVVRIEGEDIEIMVPCVIGALFKSRFLE